MESISEETKARIDAVDRQAEHAGTPCGDGSMVWRIWGSGPPLLLLHGGYGSWMHWIRNIEPLSRQFTVYAPDTPGMGESAAPPEPVTPDSLADIIVTGIGEILPRDRQFHLAGFSFGGLLAGFVAARLGDKVRRMTLIGSGGLGLQRDPTPLLRVPPDASEAEILETNRRNLEILMIADPGKIDELAVYIQTLNAPRGRIKSRRFGFSNVLAGVLPKVAAPMDGIWGERDVTAYPHMAQRAELLRSFQPQARFEVIPAAGHWVPYEAPEAFDRTLLSLIDPG